MWRSRERREASGVVEKEVIGGLDVTGWSEAQKGALRSALASKTEAEAELETIAAARAAVEADPDELVRRAQADAERARREAREAKEFEAAETKYGRGRVAMVRTVEGAIIFRAMTLEETDAAELRAATLQNIAERTTVHREAFLDTVEYPSKDEVRARTRRYPGLWGVLYPTRDRMITGVEEDLAGKPTVYITPRAGM